MNIKTKSSTAALAEPYEPTPREKEALEANRTRVQSRTLTPQLNVTSAEGGPAAIKVEHPNQAVGYALLMGAIGTGDFSFLDGLIGQLCNVSTKGRHPDKQGLNFILSIVQGVEPRDQIEAMLAAQMAATHNATMTFARRLNHVDNIAQQDSAERAFNKLARTFASQVEALKKYRNKGDQTFRVEHVTVHEGGQAIVGNVTHGGRGASKKAEPTP